MVRYCKQPEDRHKCGRARASDMRVHFKNTFETARNIRVSKMNLKEAQSYLRSVIDHKRCVPFLRYNHHIGRTSQAKEFGCAQGRWPEKSCRFILDLLRNAEANAEVNNLDPEKLKISHLVIQRARKGHRRTYRAHGRINPFMSNPCHMEVIVEEPKESVAKPKGKEEVSLSKKATAKRKLRPGPQ
eukprot:Filipodium_phascolosomae@DN3156_c0_g1_i1.p1